MYKEFPSTVDELYALFAILINPCSASVLRIDE
jgi:hypothetical protein